MRQELLRKGLALHCSFLGRPFIQASLSHTSPPQLPTSVLDLFSFLDVDTTQLLFIPPSFRWVPIMYLELCQPMETQRWRHQSPFKELQRREREKQGENVGGHGEGRVLFTWDLWENLTQKTFPKSLRGCRVYQERMGPARGGKSRALKERKCLVFS